MLPGNTTELGFYQAPFTVALVFLVAVFVALILIRVLDSLMKRHQVEGNLRRVIDRVVTFGVLLAAVVVSLEVLGLGFHHFLFESDYRKPAQFALVLLIAAIISKVLTAVIESSGKRIGVEQGVRRTANQSITAVIFLVAMAVAFAIFGLNIGAMVTAGGLVTAALVFATGQIINNLVSGVLILTSKAFEVGDVIQIGADRGRVLRVSIRTTSILTEDGRHMILPNMQFVSSPVINFTKVDHPDIRVSINFNVKRGARDLAGIREVIKEALYKHFVYPNVSNPGLHLRNVTGAVYSFTAYVWVTEPGKIDRIQDEALDRIKSALDGAGLEFA